MILYIFAMEDEAKDVIKSFDLVENKPFPIYKKNDKLATICGIGKANAAFVTGYVTGKYEVSKIVNLGFVGAVGNFRVGDKVMVQDAKYHDVDLTMFGYEKGQIPKSPAVFNSLDNQNPKFDKYKKVNIYTGDYFMVEKIENNYIADMEVTAIFQAGERLGIPVYSFKVVSDIIGGTDHLDEYKNFESIGSKIVKELFDEISEVI